MYKARDLGTKMMTPSNVGDLNAAVSLAPAGDSTPSAPSASPMSSTTEISVSTLQLEGELPLFEITASVNGHTETQRHSVGVGGTSPSQTLLTGEIVLSFLQGWLDEKSKQAKSLTTDELQAWINETRQQRTPPTAEQLQSWLDERRQSVADNAAWHVSTAAASEQLQ